MVGDFFAKLATLVFFCQNPEWFQDGRCCANAPRVKGDCYGKTNDAINTPQDNRFLRYLRIGPDER